MLQFGKGNLESVVCCADDTEWQFMKNKTFANARMNDLKITYNDLLNADTSKIDERFRTSFENRLTELVNKYFVWI